MYIYNPSVGWYADRKNKTMKKPVYKNYKSGKYYTFEEKNGQLEFKTVFVKDATFDAADVKTDKNGKTYKVLDCEPKTTAKGFEVYTVK